MTALVIALVGLVALLALLTWQVQTGGALVRLDGAVNAGIRPIRYRRALAAGSWISQVGTGAAGAVVSLVASGALLSGGRTGWAVPIWVAFTGAQTTTWSLKFITARRRPDFLEGITAASPSFPSAHATVSTATYGTVGLAIASGFMQAGVPGGGVVLAVAGLLILCICFSRMLLSLHYLTDVVAGITVGLFWLLVALRFT